MSTAESYFVVVNHEEQYSIWPNEQPPAGWSVVAGPDTKAACLARIEELWTDMRPRSLREFMAAAPEPAPEPEPEPDPGPDLVTRLCVEQDVELELFAERSPERVAEALSGGTMHLRFPNTRGGTLLAVALDDHSRQQTIEGATLRVSGTLELDFVACACEATISLPDGGGRGALRRL
ncbi:MbtH family protein [Enhygromyxa salina]|uniref:MbtH-like protein n=1 Tax=Enhygromyxa salina TaxID=215803 RepID=A0A2S9Y5U0_9BACT|nr:MbtH-like protein [Enhygromyxa salina]